MFFSKITSCYSVLKYANFSIFRLGEHLRIFSDGERETLVGELEINIQDPNLTSRMAVKLFVNDFLTIKELAENYCRKENRMFRHGCSLRNINGHELDFNETIFDAKVCVMIVDPNNFHFYF